MKVIVASSSSTTSNMVRGALQQAKVQNMELAHVDSPEKLKGLVGDDSVVLVDWEDSPDICTKYVTAAKAENESAPVILLCAKAKAGTTFPGMKAGAIGIVNKPFESESLVKAIADAIKRSKGASKPAVNVEFINPFIDSTKNVFTTMCGMECTRKKLFLKEDHSMLGDVSGVMGLSGDATGSVVISLPERFACIVVGRMLGEAPADKLNPEICDAVGELINMISGQAKTLLVKTKYHFSISIPSVISGSGHEISHKKGTPNIVVLFEAEGFEFAIQVCLCPSEDE